MIRLELSWVINVITKVTFSRINRIVCNFSSIQVTLSLHFPNTVKKTTARYQVRCSRNRMKAHDLVQQVRRQRAMDCFLYTPVNRSEVRSASSSASTSSSSRLEPISEPPHEPPYPRTASRQFRKRNSATGSVHSSDSRSLQSSDSVTLYSTDSLRSSRRSKRGDSAPRPQPTIEVAPGFFVPLRGAQETMAYIQQDRYTTASCFACTYEMFCIDNAEFILCPLCKTVGPLLIESDDIAQDRREGVGLGFTIEHLQKCQSEIIRNVTGRRH